MQTKSLGQISQNEIYDGGAWNVGNGVTIQTTYIAGMNEFDWRVCKDGKIVDYGLGCSRPGYPLTVAYVVLNGAYANGAAADWWIKWQRANAGEAGEIEDCPPF